MASPETSGGPDKDRNDNPSAASGDEATTEESSARSGSRSLFNGSDIAALLQSEGPTIKAVLLRHMRRDGKDTKPHAHLEDSKMPAVDDTEKHRPILEELIDEVEIDTTPSRNHVKEVLGGDFTFLGQWHTEGTIAIAQKDLTEDLPTNLKRLPIRALRQHCNNLGIDTESMIERRELVLALEEKRSQALPLNPHMLQPPLHDVNARGDILVMKVADNSEESDEEADDEKKPAKVEAMSNEEFFLNYTREEYLRFASRTDIVAEEVEMGEEEEENGVDEEENGVDEEEEDGEDEEVDQNADGDDDEEDGDYQPDEVDNHGLLNIILGGVIQKFREDNGRGPNTQELLELRSVIAAELDVEVADVPAEEESYKKRPLLDDADEPGRKRVKFTPEISGGETTEGDVDPLNSDDGDKKPEAAEASTTKEDGEGETDSKSTSHASTATATETKDESDNI